MRAYYNMPGPFFQNPLPKVCKDSKGFFTDMECFLEQGVSAVLGALSPGFGAVAYKWSSIKYLTVLLALTVLYHIEITHKLL